MFDFMCGTHTAVAQAANAAYDRLRAEGDEAGAERAVRSILDEWQRADLDAVDALTSL